MFNDFLSHNMLHPRGDNKALSIVNALLNELCRLKFPQYFSWNYSVYMLNRYYFEMVFF